MNKEREDRFGEKLAEKGLFVRGYDPLTVMRLYKAAHELHCELCKLDGKNLETWESLSLVDFVNIYAELEDLRRL